MTFQIIIRSSKTNPIGKLKGRTVSEFARNLESEGWPSEFKNEGERDRVAFEERKLGRPITKADIKKIK
jgi:hypothetical protein